MCISNQGTSWLFYDGGLLVGTQQTRCAVANIVLSSNYLGRSNWNGDPLLQGAIAQFQVYARVLSEEEVATLYAYNGANAKHIDDCTQCSTKLMLHARKLTYTHCGIFLCKRVSYHGADSFSIVCVFMIPQACMAQVPACDDIRQSERINFSGTQISTF